MPPLPVLCIGRELLSGRSLNESGILHHRVSKDQEIRVGV